ncbi:hypothetical protein [uncultured Pseudodesulfovibrio sp.]|uniref:hypothetical protein n=1 Tax=uncultured Pseudodesulfovibrio sp. TaxID=2035858 RepID=UPI0029C72A36|nr:hypothetical protein [uncultured Pseudodesulfovibrio sp.]
MITYLARSNYLHEVQRTFGGTGNLDVMGFFTQALSVLVPMVLVIIFWRYRRKILFFAVRFFVRNLFSRSRRIIENYLVSRGVVIEVCLYSGDGVGKRLCSARVTSVVGGRMKLQLIDTSPVVAKLKSARVICLMKPFAYSGRRINSFVTFISHMKRRGIVIKELSLMTPVRYKHIIRRQHARQRVAREGTVRVKMWSGRKANTFWMQRPELQTVNNPARYGEYTRLIVENVSAGGMRMYVVNPKGALPPLQKGNQLVLRVSIWNPKTNKYTYFTVLGTIRSRFSGRGGAIGLGIQFTSEGEPVGSRYTWRAVDGGIKSLGKFLSQLQG